ncbi:MAG: PD40 domain-containing protein [Bacteroidaceae bacterium]|nr:PD40 domain-containing protein [Bacteroidaceae bacterium]
MTLFTKLAACGLLTLLMGCSYGDARDKATEKAPIFPDYTDVTVPANIAPLNFSISGAKHLKATLTGTNGEELKLKGSDYIDIPLKKWHELTAHNQGKSISVSLQAWTEDHPEGVSYPAFQIHIDAEPIDDYAVYRLIPPGYEEWNKMGIYQRNLTDFTQTCIVENRQNNKGCVNCHNFAWYNPERMMFHARGKGGGTIVTDGGTIQKIDLPSLGPHKGGTYPMWHPSGNYIIFSSNKTRQSFYTHCYDKIEVYDLESDLILYDAKRQTVTTDERFTDSINWETFPAFSPDGKYLYFCTAKAKAMPMETGQLKYSLVRVPFDEETGQLGEPIDTIYSADRQGGSVSVPRISPDGRYVLFTWASCATFHIQHKEADLHLIDLATNEEIVPDNVNSDETDSYHAWSSNGRWVLFASRRLDGRYTRLFIAPFKDGQFGKPFLLPQRDPKQNELLLFSYNVPELAKGKVNLPSDQLAEMFNVD